MPKILINEKDRTSPGTPSSHSNYAVLIAGFCGRTAITIAKAEEFNSKNAEDIEQGTVEELIADTIQPDSNGVYEFSSAQEFIDTIGLCAPKVTAQLNGGITYSAYHYGNQMAYELLNLGYPIVYRPIVLSEGENPAEGIAKMANADFWEIFKDKASYDFRFITHGLLSTTAESAEITAARERLKVVMEARDVLDDMCLTAGIAVSTQPTDYTVEQLEQIESLYEAKYADYEGFKGPDGQFYDQYMDNEEEGVIGARTGTNNEIQALNSTIENFLESNITNATFNKINGCIANLARYVADDKGVPLEDSGRGDCIALIELDETKYISSTSARPESLIIDAISEMTEITEANGTYCAMTVPSVIYKMSDDTRFGNNKKFPGAFHYLACFMKALRAGFAEWYAAAGYTRGVSDYTVHYTTVKLGEIAINALEPRNIVNQNTDPKFACNVIANFRGNYYLWGNRTAYPLGEANGNKGDLVASHFLNIRQLCTTIKKQLYVACRRFTFDPNSDTLWVNFCNAIRPTLEAMKADQGIRDYKILKVYTDKKATLKAKIRIIPIEAVEDFDLEVSLEDSFGETTAVVTE